MTDAADIAAFIDAAPRQLTYSELARLCAERFGERTWSEDEIRIYCWRVWRRRRRDGSRIERDPEVKAFLEDRLLRETIDEAHAECLAEFGPERTPSKTAIGRHLIRYRQRLRAMSGEPEPVRRRIHRKPKLRNRP
jgi:hypothetical protein